jgi:hypothetical protein
MYAMIQTPRALSFGAFLLFVFAIHWFYISAPEGTRFGLCPAPDGHNLRAADEYVCPASCSRKNSELEKVLDVQQLCGGIWNLKNDATEKIGHEAIDEEQTAEEETGETPNDNESETSALEATGGPSNYSLGTLNGNLRDVMNETLGVTISQLQYQITHANLCNILVPKNPPCEPPRTP